MSAGLHGVLASALAGIAGAAILWQATDGLSAFTAESARRAEVLRSPRALPAARLQDQDGAFFSLDDYHGRLLAVEFIYTRCETVCLSLGAAFRQIHDRVPPQALGRDFALLSLSFDPEHDQPAQLRDYARRFGADGRHWRVARVPDRAALDALLERFGVVVIPDRHGGFEHNAALHLVDREGRLARIADAEDVQGFVASVEALR